MDIGLQEEHSPAERALAEAIEAEMKKQPIDRARLAIELAALIDQSEPEWLAAQESPVGLIVRRIGHQAARGGELETLRVLLAHPRAELFAHGEAGRLNGITLLMSAAMGDWPDCIEILLPCSDVRQPEPHNAMTALHLAAMSGPPRSFELLRPGSDLLAKDSRGSSALTIATQHQNMEWVRLLLPVADVESRDIYGWTPLCEAISQNNPALVELLMTKFDPRAADEDGVSAISLQLDWLTHQRLECMELLGPFLTAEQIQEAQRKVGAEKLPRLAAIVAERELRKTVGEVEAKAAQGAGPASEDKGRKGGADESGRSRRKPVAL